MRIPNCPSLLNAALLFLATAAFATTPLVIVNGPSNNQSVSSPVHYVASATSSGCSKGIASIRIYSAPNVAAFTIGGGQLNTYIPLKNGSYNTVVQAYDNCGGVGKAVVKINVTSQSKPAGFLYMTSSGYDYGNKSNQVFGFTIVAGGNGALAPTGQGPVNANVFPVSVASDKGGYRLYVGDRVSGDVFAYYIYRNDGYIYPVPGSPFPVNRSVTAVAVHPSGKLVFATRDENAAGDGVEVFQVQSNGALTQAPGSPYSTQNGPQALVVDPSGKYLYVADGSGYIDAFEISETSAALTPLPGSPFKLTTTGSCGAFPTDIIDPFGKNLYTANAFEDSISGYAIGSTTGALTQIAGSPWADSGGCVTVNCPQCAFNPESLAVDGSGKFLYALNGDIEDISIYSINSSGALTYIKDTPNGSACGTTTGAIRTDLTGNYVYTFGCGTSIGAPDIVTFSINHTTGDLTPIASSPMPVPNSYPTNLAVTP